MNEVLIRFFDLAIQAGTITATLIIIAGVVIGVYRLALRPFMRDAILVSTNQVQMTENTKQATQNALETAAIQERTTERLHAMYTSLEGQMPVKLRPAQSR